MARIWTRTSRYIGILWIGTLALEAGVLVLMARTNNSWLLLLALALLLIPLAAVDRTWAWFGREPRKRWKRHDVEDALAAAAKSGAAPAPVPPAPAPRAR